MVAIARATAGGIGNFRFAAAANVPAGTPFFPVAYHSGADAVAIGLESPPLLSAAFDGASTLAEAKQRLTELFESRVGPLERLVRGVARRDERSYGRSEEHTSELQSPCNLVCRLLLVKKNRGVRDIPVGPIGLLV